MSRLESQPEKIGQKTILEIEAELLRRAGCAPEDNEKCKEWIDAHAKKFRDIAEGDPALSELWQTDPEAALRGIEGQLYTD